MMKKNVFFLSLIFLLFCFFNYCTPLIFDDYVYSYIWTAGNMEKPLAYTAQRINGFEDILLSQWNHYFSWGGRTIAHALLQFFLWQGKSVFIVFNSLCFVVLLLEMQWLIDKGEINLGFKVKDICWIFAVLWIFSIMMGDIFVWMSLSCNYLWTTVLVLAFLLIYERDYFLLNNDRFFRKHDFLMFLFGVIAGWTNENIPCFIILILSYHLFMSHKSDNTKTYLLTGFIGLIIGYLMLILAPGNYVRYETLLNLGRIHNGITLIKENFVILLRILILRFVLLFYVFKNLFFIKNLKLNKENKKAFIISTVFLTLSLGSLLVMLFAPEFRFRSSFPGLIFLIVSAGLIRNIKYTVQDSFMVKQNFALLKCLRLIVLLYVFITLATSIHMYNLQRQQTCNMLAHIYKEIENPSGRTLIVRERPYALKDAIFYNAITGFHLVFPYSILTDEHWWINKDISMYYGIKAIKTEKGEAFQ